MMREALFARPSFLSGLARLFDFWGTFNDYNRSPDEYTSDARAIGSDWRAVGDDIRVAMRQYEGLYPSQEELEDDPENRGEPMASTSEAPSG